MNTTIRKQSPADRAFLAIAIQAAKDMNAGSLQNPYMASSENSDAYQIGAWHKYEVGGSPLSLHKSKGHSWIVEARHGETLRMEVVSLDHRTGVKVIESL